MIPAFASAHSGLIGLIFFFVFFAGIAVWAYNPKRKKEIEAHKHIPLREE